ncbi:hypothetical protein LCGC14_1982050 [marine sediment metagenome]|uniref:Uncharacterized protein n=1 Tax=marine sediment metagenome TaxID=412755 RepID=A0A0F9I5M8_9ZZZZ
MTELEELRANKIKIANMLAAEMLHMKFNDFKDFKIDDEKGIPFIDATIEILEKQVANARLGQAKLIKFDKLEQERANLSDEDLKKLQDAQDRTNKITDSFLATLEPRTSLKGRLYAPNTVILRYKGKSVGDDFNKKYPYGVLL